MFEEGTVAAGNDVDVVLGVGGEAGEGDAVVAVDLDDFLLVG